METIIKNLSGLIQNGESETIEFKKTFGDEALETIGSFSNSNGGTLLIGVKDSGAVIGLQIGKKTLEDIANRIQESTDPRIQPSISILGYQGKNIIFIQVSPIRGMPVSVRGRYFRRTGRTNQRMSHEEIMQRMVASTGLSWDAVIETSANLNDLNPEKINQFIQTVKNNGRFPVPEQVNPNEVLRKMDLLKDGSPTRAALLLFGNNPESWFSSAFIKAGRFRSPTLIVDDREIHGTLIDQLEGSINWFKERLETKFVITGNPEREVRWEYPLSAIREAITNAICHRDYTSLAHTQIRLYDDRMEIWNSGNLPPGLTPESLLHEHDSMPRNRKIAESFFYSGFIERWGSGTLRMAEELKTAGLPEPEFKSESGRFRLIFYKHQISKKSMQGELSDRGLKIIAYINDHGSITNSEYQELTGVSKRTASRELSELKDKGILTLAGSVTGRGTVYTLQSKGPKGPIKGP